MQSAALSSVGLTAGCSTVDKLSGGPNFELVGTVSSEAQTISIDNPSSNRFTFTIQNTGDAGNVTVALFWQMRENATEPETVGFSLDSNGFVRERTQEVYFEEDERRTISMNATPPSDAVGYYFGGQPSTYGARVRNEGSGGEISLRMDYVSNVGVQASESKSKYVESDSLKEILFNVMVKPGADWEIQQV